MDEKEKQLLIAAGDIFMMNGVKSMTMDDIARALKISKKTLYKFVKDKNDLVCKSIGLVMDSHECEFDEICDRIENPIEELREITLKAAEQLKLIHPSVMYDIRKFHPEAWEYFEDHKNTHIYECVIDNLKRGQNTGVYREDINSEIISKLYVARFEILFDPEIFPPSKFTLVDVHNEMMQYHFYGILTPKGIEELNKYNSKK